LLVMGIPGAVAIGVFTAVVSVVPILGGFIALIPIGLAPLIEGSTVLQVDRLTLVLLVVGVNLVIQLIMWNALQPLILGNAVSLSVSVVILVVAIGTVLGGLLGAFIAVPVAAVFREVAIYALRKIRGGDPYPDVPEPAFVARGSPGSGETHD
jgi:putative heme transporter